MAESLKIYLQNGNIAFDLTLVVFTVNICLCLFKEEDKYFKLALLFGLATLINNNGSILSKLTRYFRLWVLQRR